MGGIIRLTDTLHESLELSAVRRHLAKTILYSKVCQLVGQSGNKLRRMIEKKADIQLDNVFQQQRSAQGRTKSAVI